MKIKKSRAWLKYAHDLLSISNAIVSAQTPIRILDAIKWPEAVDRFLLKENFKKMPTISAQLYQSLPLGYDPGLRIQLFETIIDDIKQKFGSRSALAKLLQTTCRQYQDACRLISARGTPAFGVLSKKLYGSTHDRFKENNSRTRDLGNSLKEIIDQFDIGFFASSRDEKKLSAKKVARLLNQRFNKYFHSHKIIAEVSDNIVADAAAGSDRVRLRQDTLFSQRDVDIYEVHEGWVHIGTTLNGKAQPYAKWLSKGPPRVTVTQEGLAVMMEMFTFRTTPLRLRRINDRLYGIHLVEEGANILELAEFYRTQGYEAEEILYNVRRIFRGAPLTGGSPFTKDLCYARGFVENFLFMREAMTSGRAQLIPFIFAGKVHVSDIPLIYRLHQEGFVTAPHYLPELFNDLSGLAVWMSFSKFLNQAAQVVNISPLRKSF